MQTTPDQRLLEWIRKFRTDLTPEGTITRLELYHSIEGQLGERLATFEMADRDEDEDPDDLAQEVWDQTEEDAATRPTGQIERYTIQAFRGDTREPDEQKSFTTRGKLVTALTGNSSEPPTEFGMRTQGMRQSNDLHALVVRMCEASAGSMAVQLERERQENNRLRGVAIEAEQLKQAMLDRQLDRDLARSDAQQSQQLMMMLTQTLLQFAPLILQRLLAPAPPSGAAMPLAPAAPAAAAPAPAATAAAAAPSTATAASSSTANPVVTLRDSAIGRLLETMTPEQVAQLTSVFTPEQTQTFLGVYTSFREHPPSPVPGGKAPSASSPHPGSGERHHAN